MEPLAFVIIFLILLITVRKNFSLEFSSLGKIIRDVDKRVTIYRLSDYYLSCFAKYAYRFDFIVPIDKILGYCLELLYSSGINVIDDKFIARVENYYLFI